MTAPYLSRLLIEYTGRSFVDWRNRIRLDRFMDGFRPGANLLAAALDAGFGSYARFHHVFGEIIGCTPSEWARQAEHAGAAPDERRNATLPPGYGVPAAGMLSARQGWTRLLPSIGPAVSAVLGPVVGESFLDRLLATAPADALSGKFDHLDASLKQAACERLVASLRARDPAIAEDLAERIRAHDFPGIAAGIFGVFDLSPSCLPDAVTALTTVVREAANRAGDPGVGQVEAVGRQVRGALRGTFLRLDLRAAQDAHDALLCDFVVACNALRAARASGDPRAVDQMAEAARQCGQAAFGGDLAKVRLPGRGFVQA